MCRRSGEHPHPISRLKALAPGAETQCVTDRETGLEPVKARGIEIVHRATALTSQRTIAVLTAFVVLFGVLLSGASAAPAEASTTSRTEASFVSKINRERAVRHKRRLVVRADLVRVARQQAARMAARNRLYHNPKLATSVRNYRWVGENVGYGPSVAKLHTALMRSPGHRANILDRDYTEVGVGVVYRNGRIWVAEVFRQPRRR
jgi:uncharacterized protein YkwD